MPLVIHIGSHKAGSSSIQAFLREQAETLRRHGVLYPRAGRGDGMAHHQLASGLRQGKAAQDQGKWKQIQDLRARATSDQRLILSSEGFETLSTAAVAQLQQLVGSGPTTILFYVRDVGEAVVAAYSQRSKSGSNTDDFDRFFEHSARILAVRRVEVVRRWVSVFGADNVRVRTIEPSCLVAGDLTEDVLSVLGCSLATLGATPAPRQNVSPGWKLNETLRWLHGYIRKTTPEAEHRTHCSRLKRVALEASAVLGLGAERGAYLTAEQHRACAGLTRSMIEDINAIMPGTRLAVPAGTRLVERQFLPSVEHVPPAELAALMGHVAVALLATPPIQAQGHVAQPRRARQANALATA
ncbi:hypothetical protein [Falsiroseomonas sp. E2-1-a20]|uniref:hypothetical protein n=1 Tax=Falsiroseomonas sp. E2-1-a20 TaxID=3239300 RepID=UPI003F4075BB